MTIAWELKKLANPERAKLSARYFKTGKGEYAEGDLFCGLTTPQVRAVAGKFQDLPLSEVEQVLQGRYHEERTVALIILKYQFHKGDEATKRKIYELYLRNTKHINNWDLVDISAGEILGVYLANKRRDILFQLAKSKMLWERRMAIMATFYYIRQGEYSDTLKISEILLKDEHDLIHKAVGWMLREVGKQDKKTEEEFLRKNLKIMPRTMLRYAIEKFPEKERRLFLKM